MQLAEYETVQTLTRLLHIFIFAKHQSNLGAHQFASILLFQYLETLQNTSFFSNLINLKKMAHGFQSQTKLSTVGETQLQIKKINHSLIIHCIFILKAQQQYGMTSHKELCLLESYASYFFIGWLVVLGLTAF